MVLYIFWPLFRLYLLSRVINYLDAFRDERPTSLDVLDDFCL